MELREAILGRRSIRAFREGEVPADALAAMKEAILWAPSAGNLQARSFTLVTDPAVRQALGACSFQPEIFTGASLVVVASTDARIREKYGEKAVELFAVQDVAAAVQNLLLTVHAYGLGAVWIAAFDPAKVRATLSLEASLGPVALVPIGWPAEAPEAPERFPAERVFHEV